MRNPRLLLAFVAVTCLVLLQAGCICVREERVHDSMCKSPAGKLTISVDPESVKESGPVEVYIEGQFYGHMVKDTEFAVMPGNRSIMLKRRGFRPYMAIVRISPEQPVLIVPSFGKE